MSCSFNDEDEYPYLENQIADYLKGLVECYIAIADGKLTVMLTEHNKELFDELELCDDITLTSLNGNITTYYYKELIEISIYRINS